MSCIWRSRLSIALNRATMPLMEMPSMVCGSINAAAKCLSSVGSVFSLMAIDEPEVDVGELQAEVSIAV